MIGMITISEATSLAGSQAHFKALKPWWDVLMDYFLVLMVMVSFFSATLLLTMDKVVCMPMTTKSLNNKSSELLRVGETFLAPRRDIGLFTNLDYQQYMYVSVVCYNKVVPWRSKYFPYLALVNTLLLLVSSNFWFKYPKTASKVDHFLSIVAKCFESPWTTRALEETTDQPPPEHARLKSSGSRSAEYSPRTPLLQEFSSPPIQLPVSTILDRKEEEQAKALFEKIRHFRTHAEESDVVYRVYLGQTIFKVVKVVIVLIYAFSLVGSFHFHRICKPGIQNLMGYSVFKCTHNLANILEKLVLTYIILVCVYALLAVYSLFWLLSRPLKIYSFEKNSEENGLGDIPDVKKDFAFLLHMVDRYDSLYSRRFSVFLSAVSEGRLRELALNSEWSRDKLRELVSKDSQGRWVLLLSMLPAIPRAVYDMTEIEVLKLELISSAKIIGMVSKLRSLSELHLSHCTVKLDPDAYNFLQKRLQILCVKFTDIEELPAWMYCMKSLHQLHLSGNLNSSNNKTIRLQSLRGLASLTELFLTSNLSHLPSAILDVAGQLSKLSIQNGGTVLGSLSQLRKMSNLVYLQLRHCQIIRTPVVVSSLTKLQCLDLAFNALQKVDELGTLQRLRNLCTLRLSHNAIYQLSPSIELLYNLEELSMSQNRVETLPLSLFSLVKLRHFDISYNSIRVIPPEIGHLTRLELLALTGNQISSLPRELFRCTRLKSLHVGSNKLTTLPSEIGHLSLLSSLELTGNNLNSLPEDLASCVSLRRGGLDIDEQLIKSLPSELRKQL
ncbi:volume-regulated anion channel subunit LRRC8D-like isoform 2-T2 [Discoglossus pictus]